MAGHRFNPAQRISPAPPMTLGRRLSSPPVIITAVDPKTVFDHIWAAYSINSISYPDGTYPLPLDTGLIGGLNTSAGSYLPSIQTDSAEGRYFICSTNNSWVIGNANPPSNQLTIGARIRMDSSEGAGFLFCGYGGNGFYAGFTQDPYAPIYPFIGKNNGSALISCPTPVAPGATVILVIVCDGSNATFYVDSTIIGIVPCDQTYSGSNFNLLGNTTVNAFNGRLYWLGSKNAALTPAQVNSLGVGTDSTAPPGESICWIFSGYGFDGNTAASLLCDAGIPYIVHVPPTPTYAGVVPFSSAGVCQSNWFPGSNPYGIGIFASGSWAIATSTDISGYHYQFNPDGCESCPI